MCNSNGRVFAVRRGAAILLLNGLLDGGAGGHAVAVVLEEGVGQLLPVGGGQLEVQVFVAALERALPALLLLDDLAGVLFVDARLRLALAYRAATT